MQLFKPHGENELIPKLVDFKGKSWKQQQQRFILLYVWAYSEILGRPAPSNDSIMEVAKKSSNIYDRNNMRRHYEEVANEYLLSTNEGLELNPRAFQFVQEILAEIEDSSVDEGYVYWKGTTKPAPKRSAPKKNQQEVDEWVNKSVDIGNFDVRTLNDAAKWAMFAIWSITKRLNVADAVKRPMAYQYLTKKYTRVPVKQNALSEAMRRNNNKFQRTADGRYYLTPQAQQEVESWIEKGTVGETEA